MKEEDPEKYAETLDTLLKAQSKCKEVSKARILRQLSWLFVVSIWSMVFITCVNLFKGPVWSLAFSVFIHFVLLGALYLEASYFIKHEGNAYRGMWERLIQSHATKILKAYEKLYRKEKGE